MSQSRVAPMPDTPTPVPSLTRLHRCSAPLEILFRATKGGASPEVLLDRYGIEPWTLRRLLSGYRPFERLGGSEKIWDRYFYDHEEEIRSLWKPADTR